MSLRILHVLDHSIPLHSGYTFRTRAILREQRRMGWETFHLTSPKHSAPSAPEEDVDGLHFYRTLWQPGPVSNIPGMREIALMRATARRLAEVARTVRPDILHAHSPVLNALPALWVGRRLGIPVVYEVRAFWEDAAADHGTGREWGLALSPHARRRDVCPASRRRGDDDLRGPAVGDRGRVESPRTRSRSFRTPWTSRISLSEVRRTKR